MLSFFVSISDLTLASVAVLVASFLVGHGMHEVGGTDVEGGEETVFVGVPVLLPSLST